MIQRREFFPALPEWRTPTRLYFYRYTYYFLDSFIIIIYFISMPADKKPPKVFASALLKAMQELEAVKEQEKQIAVRRAHLNETIKALWPLVMPDKLDIKSLSLPNAIRLIFRGIDEERTLTVSDVKSKLVDLGYDLSQYGDNPLANISTTLSRMAETNELRHIVDESKKKKFEPGPELKPVPEATDVSASDMAQIAQIAESQDDEAK